MISGEFLRFLLTGGFAAATNLAARGLLNLLISFEVAVVLAYLIGMVTAYILARIFVFKSSGRSVASEFKRFAVVNFFALALVWSISVLLARVVFPFAGFTWHAEDVAHLAGVLAPAIVSYFGHRAYTFAGAPQ
jgi:putative flippase GtrA